MPVDVLVGLQWGDEGKGKIVDVLAPTYDAVARFQGGPNAGHTLTFDGVKHVLHQVPSGIFHPHILNVVGNGVVLDPVVFRAELQKLTDRGVGLRVSHILLPDFQERYQEAVAHHASIAAHYNKELEIAEFEADFFSAAEFLRTLQLIDTEYLLNDLLRQGKRILAEGAQGSLLDIDFGTYPYVTSSSTIAAGACTGLGIAPRHIDKVYGITKAYCTRVGSGPFPTELHDEIGEQIRQAGCEFGSTTGRPRRTGWIDLPALRYAIMLNGVTELHLMKADVLDEFAEIQACTHYRTATGESTPNLPDPGQLETITPEYQAIPGWNTDLTQVTDAAQFPQPLQDYLAFLEKELQVPIRIVSVGPDRVSTLFR